MNNPRFTDSELIKEEVDDMEECLNHFEAAASSFPISGRTLSENELSDILEVLRANTSFVMENRDESEGKTLVIHIPIFREKLVSAEIEQELCFAWGFPFHTSWSDDWSDEWTEYSFSLFDLKEKGILVKHKESLKQQFLNLYFNGTETGSLQTDDTTIVGKLMKRITSEDLTMDPQIIEKRLNYELDLIKRTGLENYVEAFGKLMDVAKRKDMPVFIDSLDGDGSLVLYCLGITGRNPLQYCLGFSSFLSMDRLTIPWFGIICRHADEHIIYSKLASYFGEDKVGLIPNGIGVDMGGYRVGPPVPSFIDDYTKERLFMVQTSELEQNGIVPISLDETQLLENLIKAESHIRQHHPDFSQNTIPDDDVETFNMLSDGDTDGLPLLSDKWMKKNLCFLEPRTLDELDVLISLYHNGPADLIPMYLDAKRGMLPEAYQGLLEIEPLKRTSGVIVYREQVFEVLKRYAGFSDYEARSFLHLLMRGKRQSIEKYKNQFLESADMLGRDRQLSKIIISMIECFSTESGFGFNRKVGFWHTVLAYRNAYIRCHYDSVNQTE